MQIPEINTNSWEGLKTGGMYLLSVSNILLWDRHRRMERDIDLLGKKLNAVLNHFQIDHFSKKGGKE